MHMKYNIAIVGGGNSGEAEISLQSTEMVENTLDTERFNTFKIIISGADWELWSCSLQQREQLPLQIDKNDFSVILDGEKIRFDCVFLAIHGTPGEDGKLQGYFDLLGLPYTACGVLTSALTFNKGACKTFLRQYDIVSANDVVVTQDNYIGIEMVLEKVGIPCFVKPNNGGSSLGASRVIKEDELDAAIRKALTIDDEVIVEDFIVGIELTCGVVTYNGKVKALSVTEIVSENDFFDFEAKYVDKTTQEITPARIPEDKLNECMALSERIYKTLDCKGMVRMDYFLTEGLFYMIEVNSIPGLTERSLIPQQAEHCGISMRDLYTDVIEQAMTMSK